MFRSILNRRSTHSTGATRNSFLGITRALALGCALIALVLLGASTRAIAAPAVSREFSLRYDILGQGVRLQQIGNMVRSCQSGTTSQNPSNPQTCTNVRNDSNNNNSDWNDYFMMLNFDIDGDTATTINSSSADLTLPASFTVQRAQLYWGGSFNPFTASGQTNANKMKFKRPGGTYQEVTADNFDTIDITNGGTGRVFGATKDVTSLLTTGSWATGTYWGGDILGTQGCTIGSGCNSGAMGNYGGWALIIIYVDNDNPLVRYAAINDGFKCVYDDVTCDAPLNVTFTGFNIPSAVSDRRWGLLAWDGDSRGTLDTFTMNGVLQSDANHFSNNYFRSRISINGAVVTTRNPLYYDTLGMDMVESNTGTFSGTSVTGFFDTDADVVGAHYFWLEARSTADDYGDDPASYGVVWHDISLSATKLRMGTATTDPEAGMQNTGLFLTNALGDDNNGTDDEDGVTNFITSTTVNYQLIVAVQNTYAPAAAANLYCWIDVNQNGIFEDTEARTGTVAANTSQTVPLTWNGVGPRNAGTVFYSRCRLTTNTLTDTDPTSQDGRSIGNTSNGEVEDHRIVVQVPTAVTLEEFKAGTGAKGKAVTVRWKTGTELAVAGFNVWRSNKRNGKNKLINSELIPAQAAGQISGGKYKFKDKGLKSGKTYFYQLEVVGPEGTTVELSDIKKVQMP